MKRKGKHISMPQRQKRTDVSRFCCWPFSLSTNKKELCKIIAWLYVSTSTFTFNPLWHNATRHICGIFGFSSALITYIHAQSMQRERAKKKQNDNCRFRIAGKTNGEANEKLCLTLFIIVVCSLTHICISKIGFSSVYVCSIYTPKSNAYLLILMLNCHSCLIAWILWIIFFSFYSLLSFNLVLIYYPFDWMALERKKKNETIVIVAECKKPWISSHWRS